MASAWTGFSSDAVVDKTTIQINQRGFGGEGGSPALDDNILECCQIGALTDFQFSDVSKTEGAGVIEGEHVQGGDNAAGVGGVVEAQDVAEEIPVGLPSVTETAEVHQEGEPVEGFAEGVDSDGDLAGAAVPPHGRGPLPRGAPALGARVTRRELYDLLSAAAVAAALGLWAVWLQRCSRALPAWLELFGYGR